MEKGNKRLRESVYHSIPNEHRKGKIYRYVVLYIYKYKKIQRKHKPKHYISKYSVFHLIVKSAMRIYGVVCVLAEFKRKKSVDKPLQTRFIHIFNFWGKNVSHCMDFE